MTIFIEGQTYDLELCNLPVVCTWRYLGDTHHSPDFGRLEENKHLDHIIQCNSDNEVVEVIKVDQGGLNPQPGELSFGYYIRTKRSDGITQFYPHLKYENRFNIKVGQVLKKGQSIGVMGNTGSALGKTGVHVHPEMRINNKYINNQDYLNFKNSDMNKGVENIINSLWFNYSPEGFYQLLKEIKRVNKPTNPFYEKYTFFLEAIEGANFKQGHGLLSNIYKLFH